MTAVKHISDGEIFEASRECCAAGLRLATTSKDAVQEVLGGRLGCPAQQGSQAGQIGLSGDWATRG